MSNNENNKNIDQNDIQENDTQQANEDINKIKQEELNSEEENSVEEEKTEEENSTESEEKENKKAKEQQEKIQEKLKEGKNFEFNAEIKKLLDILIHSLYTHKEIFLRELISNAADAIDKIRFRMLTEKDLRESDSELGINIEVDKNNKLLIISDNGIGMNQDELIENIGTIAHSGSMAFLQKMAENKEQQSDVNLIGQFGVGFYAVFMVAKQVDILTLSADPNQEAVVWSSDGSGNYKIAPAQKEGRGTEIHIHLKDDAAEYLETAKIENIVQRYSDFVSYPIKLENKQINQLSAIWRRPPFQVKKEEYEEYYKYLTHMHDAPLAHIHVSFDAPIQFNSILFIPKEVPFDMKFDIPEKWRGIHLYAKRVFIQSDCEDIMPQYLRFIRGVVDSDDLPLNISRETLQENQIINKIKKNLVNKVLDKFSELSKKQKEDYKTLWINFGKFIKQGYRSDYGNRDKLADLFRFNSSGCENADELVSLQDYVDRMVLHQENIYYISGESRETIEKSPHLDIFKRKGIEVIYLTDPVDDFLMSDLVEFKGKKIACVDQEDLDFDKIEDKENKEETDEKKEKIELSDRSMDDFIGFIKTQLQDRVTDVKISKRLVDSPCCLVSSKNAPNVGMQKIFKLMNEKYEMPKRILEINQDHSLIRRMANIYEKNPREAILGLMSHQLLDNALLLEGTPLDTRDMVPRIQEILEYSTNLINEASIGKGDG